MVGGDVVLLRSISLLVGIFCRRLAGPVASGVMNLLSKLKSLLNRYW